MNTIAAQDSGNGARSVGESALTMLSGVILSMVVLYTVSRNPHGATVALGVLAGMIVGQAVWTATRR